MNMTEREREQQEAQRILAKIASMAKKEPAVKQLPKCPCKQPKEAMAIIQRLSQQNANLRRQVKQFQDNIQELVKLQARTGMAEEGK
jgi:cell division protein FtsB